MKLVLSDFVITCDENFNVIKNGGVCFDEKIIEVGDSKELAFKYKNIKTERLSKNSILMPGLINSHVHLEFSANIAKLQFGDFMEWLKSVINSRESLKEECTGDLIEKTLKELLKSGTTAIGAISSFGVDFEPCIKTPMSIVYFVEAIGSNPAAIDTLFNDFKARFFEAKNAKSKSFFPAISVHSPYSTHPILARHVLEIAQKEDVQTTAHFMESLHERAWIDKAEGKMGEFMKSFNAYSKPMSSAEEFLRLFEGCKTLFAHAAHANKNELETIAKQSGGVITCPRSNRLLGVGRLDLALIQKLGVSLALGTDGLSSNNSLNLWDEMRAALMMHTEIKLNDLAVLLFKSATTNGGKVLGLNKGRLQEGYDADMIALRLKEIPDDISQLPLQVILQTKEAKKVYVNGKDILQKENV